MTSEQRAALEDLAAKMALHGAGRREFPAVYPVRSAAWAEAITAALTALDKAGEVIAAVEGFLADEDAMMESLLAEGKKLEDYGFPFPRVVAIRSAVTKARAAANWTTPRGEGG